MFSGKRIVLGVTGGIAAYKAVEISRRLVDAGAHVSPIMTNAAKKFIGEVTLSALASEPVKSSLWNEEDPIPHTTLGQEADLVEPLIIKDTSTVRDVCVKLHRDFVRKFRYARVKGPSGKFDWQRVGLDHLLKDGDILSIILRR